MGHRFPISLGRALPLRAFIKPVAIAALGRRFSRTFWQRNLLGLIVWACVLVCTAGNAEEVVMELEPQWEYVSDRVMGGVSNGKIETVSVDGRTGTRLTGLVSL